MTATSQIARPPLASSTGAIERITSHRPLSLAWSVSSDTHPDALQIYRESLADLYDVRDVASRGRSAFVNQTKVIRFGASILGRGRSVGQTFVRDAQLVRRSGLDHVSITVSLADGAGDFDGHTAHSGGGSVQFRDLARPSTSTAIAVDLVHLIVPRHLLPSWLLGRWFHGLTLPGESASARLIASHLCTLFEVADELSEDEGISAVEATFVIAERFLGRRHSVSPPHTDAIHRTIRRRAMHLFDSNLLPHSPTVGDVAEMIGVSRSGLYRAFEPMGGVMAYVGQRRLDRVYAALRARASTSRTIDELATLHGFSDSARLASAFKRRFGCSLHDVHPSMLSCADGSILDVRGEIDRAAHDVVIDWLRVSETV